MMLLRAGGAGRGRLHGLLVGGVLLLGLLPAPAALAETAPSGYLRLTTSQAPTNLTPGGKGRLLVAATNLGDASLTGEVVVTDHLPAGLRAVAVEGSLANKSTFGLQCSLKGPQEAACSYSEATPLAPLTGLKLTIIVQVGNAVTGENRVEASGAAKASVESPVKLSAEPAPFGIEKYELRPEEQGGALDLRAGSHPSQLTTTLGVTQTPVEEPVALTKNLQFSLPPGLIGNPQATSEKCSQADFNTEPVTAAINLCKAASVVGEAQVTIEEPALGHAGPVSRTVPIFNLEPAPGEPARFGLVVLKDPVVLETAVRTGTDYGVVVSAKSTSELAGLLSSTATFWGVPGDPRHNPDRGWACVAHGESSGGGYGACEAQQKQEKELEEKQKSEGTYQEPKPFLVMPTSCGTPLSAPAQIQSWVPGAALQPPFESQNTETLEGCNFLQSNPLISVEPESHSTSTPAGMTVDVTTPQKESGEGTSGEKLVESAIKSTTVALPQGLQLSPAAASGLLACSASQVGYLGSEEHEQTQNTNFSAEPASCPPEAKVATVTIKSPDLEHELEGFAYLANQNTNPFQPPLVLYLVARDPVSGVLVKLAGTVTPDPVTGQLSSTFENTPQVPFEALKLNFFGGPRATQSTPAQCGSYTTNASFTPWSGNPATPTSSSFNITSGPGGGPCPSNPLPFSPSFTAGSTNLQASSFTPFALTIKKPDGNEALEGISIKLPPGMAALLSSVTPCPEPQVARNECGPASLVGDSTASSGLGGEPFNLPGKVFLTGPYKGAPFGLSVVTPAVAGPFNLGDVTVRSTINVDRETAAVTVTSDPFPTILKGVPTQLKQINVIVDRPGFQFNPTNCNPMSITGSLTGSHGTSKAVSSPFQVANCAALPFAPKLTSTVGAVASKANGAGLNVQVVSPGLGQDNIAKVELQLPLALPSRLTTIQKACLDAVFKVNPAACDEGSLIGKATIHTPVLTNPLSGPAYLVSHGNAAFPDVEFVLQGEGITLVLDGKTDIKKGITYSRFEATPDAPFTTFLTELPTGPHSALTANVAPSKNYSLCGASLTMPTKITAQNGAVIQQSTQIKTTGCVLGAKIHKLSRAQLLAKALKKCRKQFKHNKKNRQSCERQARKRYGPKAHHKSKHSKKK